MSYQNRYEWREHKVIGCTIDSTTGYQLIFHFLDNPASHNNRLLRVFKTFVAARRRARQLADKYENAEVKIVHAEGKK